MGYINHHQMNKVSLGFVPSLCILVILWILFITVHVYYNVYLVLYISCEKTDCNQSFNVFRNFLSWGNQQPNQPWNGATTTDGPVVFGCIRFSFSLFSGLRNWTCKHYVDWSWWWHLQMCQQHQLWSWEWGGGRNQVVQDFLGDVVCPWGGGESNGRNLNLTPKLTQLPHGKPGQQQGRGPHDGGTSSQLTWWTTGQQDQPNAYIANPTTTWWAQHLCGETTTAGVMCMWWPPWWQDQHSDRVMNPMTVVPANMVSPKVAGSARDQHPTSCKHKTSPATVLGTLCPADEPHPWPGKGKKGKKVLPSFINNVLSSSISEM